jgi:outer membrane protein assembly factor BamB
VPTHRSNTYASETPVTDGKRLYVYFGMLGVFCYDLDGEQVWKKDLGTYEMKRGWGTASSLALHEDHLFVLLDSEEDSFLVALRTSDGEEAWRAERPNEPSNWSSPVIWKNNVRTELVVGGEIIRSHDPRTGVVLWELNTHGGETSASPCGNSERLVVGTEFSRARPGRPKRPGLLCSVKPGASGDITPKEGETTSPGLHWFRERGGPEMASPLIYNDYVYIVQRSSLLNCYDAKTGERVYEEKRVEGGRPFWASPWAYDGHVYCLDEAGSTHVIQPGDDYEVVAVNKLDDQFWASSAVVEGTLILRGVEGIYCIGR